MMKIPLVDLRAQYESIRQDLDTAYAQVMQKAVFIGGSAVAEFEKAFAAANMSSHCIGLANGTDALLVALNALGVGEGDEVITTSLSWISTADTIVRSGAKPVFADIESEGFNLDVSSLEARISSRTKAVVVVHLYGHPADMDHVVRLCKKYNLRLIEDCAQAHFARYKGATVGTMGDVATFSFYPTKNLGAYGDAGAIITNNDEIAAKCRLFTSQGAISKHQHISIGINSRLDTMQAAVLLAKLPYVEEWNRERRRVADTYNRLLSTVGEVITPLQKAYAESVYHLYVIDCPRRDELSQFLAEKGITTAIHYPTPLPLQAVFQPLHYSESSIPRAATVSKRILSLPMYPELSDEMCEYIVMNIRAFYH